MIASEICFMGLSLPYHMYFPFYISIFWFCYMLWHFCSYNLPTFGAFWWSTSFRFYDCLCLLFCFMPEQYNMPDVYNCNRYVHYLGNCEKLRYIPSCTSSSASTCNKDKVLLTQIFFPCWYFKSKVQPSNFNGNASTYLSLALSVLFVDY